MDNDYNVDLSNQADFMVTSAVEMKTNLEKQYLWNHQTIQRLRNSATTIGGVCHSKESLQCVFNLTIEVFVSFVMFIFTFAGVLSI